jgi:2-polyprenyl-3-methyl-5-hydroxy-6-metoxy-1,4-benzoquinol methylase
MSQGIDNNLLEVGADIDVDELMFSLREAVKHRQAAAIANSTRPGGESFESLYHRSFSQELHIAGLSAEVINQIQVKRRGPLGKIESRIKRLLKWLIHWNTKGQADFNRSILRSLESVAQVLQAAERNFAIAQSRLTDERERRAILQRDTDHKADDFRRRSERELSAVKERLNELEDRMEQRNEHTSAQFQELLTTLGEIFRKTETISVHSTKLERIIGALSQNTADLQEQLQRNTLETRQQLLADAGRLSTILQDIATNSSTSLERISQETESLAGQSSELQQRLLALEQISSELKKQVEGALNEFKMRIQRAERLAGIFPRAPDPAARVGATAELPSQPFDYFLFENRFRGGITEIKRRQAIYLDCFQGKKAVVDLGCGRGEFVELLAEHGIQVVGVDSNKDMVDFCRDRGLWVHLADAFDYLGGIAQASLDGISALQLVEHISFDQIRKLISLCGQTLKPTGVIVVETVNTNCPQALANFYLDPTHIRPVLAETLRFILEQGPFEVKFLRLSSPVAGAEVKQVLDMTAGITQDIVHYQDYAVVAVRL